jgi:hypothetical protein
VENYFSTSTDYAKAVENCFASFPQLSSEHLTQLPEKPCDLLIAFLQAGNLGTGV